MQKKNRNQLISIANKAFATSQYLKAIEALTELNAREPLKIEWFEKRGIAYLHLEMFSKGLSDIAKVVQAEPNNQSALSNFGVALLKTNKYQHARQILEYLLELNPNSYDACINLGTVYQMLSMPTEQIKVAIRAVEINPKSATAYNNLATAFGDRGMLVESLETLLIAKTVDPNFLPTLVNLAHTYFRQGNNLQAINAYEHILSIKNVTPSIFNYVRFSCAYAYLNEGYLDKGWDFYESGFGLSIGGHFVNRSLMPFPEPKWRGEDLSGKTLFVLREQGLGDELMFSTCFADLERLKASVVVKCEPRLVNIFQRTYPSLEFIPDNGLEGGIPKIYKNKTIDYSIAIGSLPGIFRRKIEDFNLPTKNLIPDEELLKEYKTRLVPYAEKKLVGICWRSGFLDITRNEGYSVLTDWQDLLTQPNMVFVNLQYGDCEAELLEAEQKFGIRILRWNDTDLKNDLERVIALMNNLDAVVSVNSAPFALGGASGVNTLLLTAEGLWTMIGQRDKFPWYKSVNPITYRISDGHVLNGLKVAVKFICELGAA